MKMSERLSEGREELRPRRSHGFLAAVLRNPAWLLLIEMLQQCSINGLG